MNQHKGIARTTHPHSCHGNEVHGYVHAKGCRPGRPKCAAMRRASPKHMPCTCAAYGFIHRAGSGYCGNERKRWARDYGMTDQEVADACEAVAS